VRVPANLALITIVLSAVNAAGQAASSSTACSAPEYRNFDFWVGTWEVRGADGELAGTNRIERILGGCALQENWTGRRGMVGTSLNAYDAMDGKWHQTWVDSNGLRLDLAGEYASGRLTLQGEGPSLREPRRRVLHRITWSRLPEDGRVRQLWETSRDQGLTWEVVFDGAYVRSKPPVAGHPGER